MASVVAKFFAGEAIPLNCPGCQLWETRLLHLYVVPPVGVPELSRFWRPGWRKFDVDGRRRISLRNTLQQGRSLIARDQDVVSKKRDRLRPIIRQVRCF